MEVWVSLRAHTRCRPHDRRLLETQLRPPGAPRVSVLPFAPIGKVAAIPQGKI